MAARPTMDPSEAGQKSSNPCAETDTNTAAPKTARMVATACTADETAKGSTKRSVVRPDAG